MNIGRRVISFAVAAAVAVALPGCKKDEKTETTAAASAGEPTKKTGDSPEGESGESGKKKPPEVAVDPSGFNEPAVSYPSALDDLLNLVPAGEKTFVVVRDPKAVLALFGTFVADQVKGLAPLAKTAEPEMGAKLEESAAIYAKLSVELAKGVLNLDKGIVFVADAEAVIYGADDPSALPNLLRTLGATEVPDNCMALAAAPGYAACGEDETKLKALVPGKQAASLRGALVSALPGFDIERGNFVGKVSEDTPAPVLFAVATMPGSIRAAIGLGGVMVGEEADWLGTGKPTALGLSDPGAAFFWARVDTAAIKPMLDGMGPPANTVGATFAGEVYAGGVKGGVPLALLLGVTDPYPASGMITMASAMIDSVPKELPGGVKLEVKVDKLQAGGKEVPILTGKLSGTKQVDSLAELGIPAEGIAFSAGKFAGAVVGAKSDAIKTIAEFEGGGATQAHLERLPPGLASVLADGSASWAFHLPLDGLQAPQMKDQVAEGMAMLPDGDRGGLSADTFANAVLSVIAPFSSLSAWMTHPDKERVLNIAVVGFADDESDKGKAARDAVAQVTGGADRKATYSALAAKFDDPRFKARSGEDPTALRSALSGAFMLGLVAALTVSGRAPMPVEAGYMDQPPPPPLPPDAPQPIDPPAPPP